MKSTATVQTSGSGHFEQAGR